MESSKVPLRRESLILNSNTFQGVAIEEYSDAMTMRGVVNKTGILLMIVGISAAAVWMSVSSNPESGSLYFWTMMAMLAALIVAWITWANKQVSRFTASLYAFLEGSVLGYISTIFEAQYPGLVIQAIFLTFGTLLGLLMIYGVSVFQVTTKFRSGVLSAMLAILMVYVLELVLPLLGVDRIPLLLQSGLIGICFSLFTIVVAALNLVMDFDLIESGARNGAPKYMEWYCAFGLMVTLIWLYLEILELLLRLYASSDDD